MRKLEWEYQAEKDDPEDRPSATEVQDGEGIAGEQPENESGNDDTQREYQRVPQCDQQIEAFVYGDEVVDGESARVGKGTGDGGVWLGLKCTDDHVPEGE